MLGNQLLLRLAIIAIVFVAVPLDGIQAQQDSDDVEENTPWTASIHGQYDNKDNSGGVDLSNDLAVFQYGIRVEHSSGASLEVGAATLFGSGGGFERWGVTLGYTRAVTTWMTLSLEYSRFKYQNDSLNAIANLTNSITLGVSFPTQLVNVGLSYNTYFGGGSASYYALNLDRTYEKNNFTINPSLNFSFISQTIDQIRLVSFKRNVHAAGKGNSGSGGTSTPTSSFVTVTGLSGITLSVPTSYDLGGGFSIKAQPTYVYSPKAELAADTNEFLWSIGLTYSRDF